MAHFADAHWSDSKFVRISVAHFESVQWEMWHASVSEIRLSAIPVGWSYNSSTSADIVSVYCTLYPFTLSILSILRDHTPVHLLCRIASKNPKRTDCQQQHSDKYDMTMRKYHARRTHTVRYANDWPTDWLTDWLTVLVGAAWTCTTVSGRRSTLYDYNSVVVVLLARCKPTSAGPPALIDQ